MTADEVVEFLATQPRVVVAALDAGAPVGTIADARLAGGTLEVTLRAGDPLARLLTLDDRVCVIAEQFPTYYQIKGVCAHGRARFVGPVGREQRAFRIALDDVTSFDFGKLPRAGAGSGTQR